MVRNSSSLGASHMSGLIGGKRPAANSVAPAPYVGPAYKRLNVGSSSNVNPNPQHIRNNSLNRQPNPQPIRNNSVIGQPNPQPINTTTTRINNPNGYVTNNNGYVARNNHHNGWAMPVEGYINPFSGQSSSYRGVTRYPGHFEAVVWDNCGIAGRPETVYLGAYSREVDAARAYDLAALRIYGVYALLNFPISNYGNEVEMMKYIPKSEYLTAIRRLSQGYQGGSTSCYHGVSRIPGTQKWQAMLPNPNAAGSILHLGAFDTEQDAARAYDFSAIKLGGNAAITNFSLNNYNVAAICNSNYYVVGSGGAKLVTLQTGVNNAVTWTPSNQWVTQNGVDNSVTWTPSNQSVPPILDPLLQMNIPQNHNINRQIPNGGANQSSVGNWVGENNDRHRGVEQNPSFSYHPHQSIPTLGGNDGRVAVPVLDQNTSFSFDQSTLGLDASRYTGGLEDMIRGFNFGGNDRHDHAEPVSGQNPSRWRLEEVKKFLEIETDEGSDDGNKQVMGQNPSQLPRITTTPPPINEFIKDMAEFIKADPNFPALHQTEASSLQSDITNLPLDESNYCGGAENLTKTLFDDIDELMNLVTGDELVMTTEPGSLSDMSNFDILPIDDISQLNWDDVASDDWSEGDGVGDNGRDSDGGADGVIGTQVGG